MPCGVRYQFKRKGLGNVTSEKWLQYEKTLKRAMFSDCFMIAFVVVVVIGLVLFVVWWKRDDKKCAKECPNMKRSNNTKVGKPVAFFSLYS